MKSNQFYGSAAWKYCSRYVLLYYANDQYIVQCATSNKPLFIAASNCHCGHYIKTFDGSKTNFATAFEFENLAPQSHQENVYAGGRPDIMRDWLVAKHGQNKMDVLNIKRHNICKLGKFEMEYWRDHYKKLFDDLVKIKGNPWRK